MKLIGVRIDNNKGKSTFRLHNKSSNFIALNNLDLKDYTNLHPIK
jgi:hypothetical protein